MDQSFIEAIILYASEDAEQTSAILADIKEWRDIAFDAIRAGAGSAIFEVTSTTQNGKSVTGSLTMTNTQVFSALTNAIDRIANGVGPRITHADFFNMGMDR
jgi:hypothetical protein